MPNTTQNKIWFDVKTERVKIASHAKFDEGMNGIPINQLPPNVIHLQRSEIGKSFPMDKYELETTDLEFFVSPFDKILTKEIHVKCNSPTFGINLETDVINNRTFVHNIKPRSSLSNVFNTVKNVRRQIKGAYITAVNRNPIFDQQSI